MKPEIDEAEDRRIEAEKVHVQPEAGLDHGAVETKGIRAAENLAERRRAQLPRDMKKIIRQDPSRKKGKICAAKRQENRQLHSTLKTGVVADERTHVPRLFTPKKCKSSIFAPVSGTLAVAPCRFDPR